MIVDSPQLNGLIAGNIRAERNRAGLSQGQLAAAIGVSVSAIVGMEKGRTSPPVTRLYRIAEVLHIPISALLPQEECAAA